MESKEETKAGLSLHELHTFTDAKRALRHVNTELGKKDVGPEAEIYREAGGLVIEMLDAVLDGKPDDSYLELLEAGNDAMLNIVNTGLIQKYDGELMLSDGSPAITGSYSEVLTKAKELHIDPAKIKATPAGGTQPDIELIKTASLIGALGTRLVEARLNLDETGPIPPEFVKFAALDDTILAYRTAASKVKELNRRLDPPDFKEIFVAILDKKNRYLADERSREIIGVTRKAGMTDPAQATNKVATYAIRHFHDGIDTTGDDEEKCRLHIRSGRVVKAMRDAVLADDPRFSAKRLFDSEMLAFLAKVAPADQKQEYEIALKKSGLPEENEKWELDAVSNKLKTYEQVLDKANDVLHHIAKHELVVGSLPDTDLVYNLDLWVKSFKNRRQKPEPDMDLVYNIEQIKNMLSEIDSATDILYNRQFNPEFSSYNRLDKGKTVEVTISVQNIAGKVKEGFDLYKTCNALVQYYGEETKGRMVTEKRVSAEVFDNVYGIIKAGGDVTAAEQKVEQYLDKVEGKGG